MVEAITEHRCLMCGADVPENKKRSSFCSEKCRNRALYQKKIGHELKYIYQKECVFCEQKFLTHQWYRVCCSTKCQEQYHNKKNMLNQREYRRKKRNNPVVNYEIGPEALCWTCSHTARDCVWRSSDGKEQVNGSKLLTLKRADNGGYSGVIRKVIECPLYEQES